VRRLASLLGALALASSAVLVWQAPAARAEAPEATGWWWRGSAPPTPIPQLSGPVQQGSPRPQVPPGGLYVSGEGTNVRPPHPSIPAPEGEHFEFGVSGVRLTVGDDAIVNDIVLEVDKDQAGQNKVQGTPVIRACVAQYFWTPEEGGRMETAPPADCALGMSFGDLVDTTVRIPAQQLVRDGVLNIVLEPASQSAFQVVFKKPGPQSITVTRFESGGGGGGEPPPNPIPTENFTFDVPGADLGTGSFDPGLSVGSLPTPLAAPAAVAAPPPSGPSRTVPVASLPDLGPVRPDRPPRLVAALILTGLVLIYLGLLQGGQLPPLPGPLGRWLPSGRGAADEVPLQGIGRFARVRSGPPPTL
jgi:hypothetical protein